MPHIHTEPGQHDHTVSIYLFRTDLDIPKVLLHFHHKMNAYAQFGGHVELNETPWQAAVHELKEEAGYDIHTLHLLQPSRRLKAIEGAVVHPQPVVHATMGYPSNGGHFHTDSVYALIADGDPTSLPDEGESDELRLFSRDEIATSTEVDAITRDIALHIFDEILPNWSQIPADEFRSK